ncbi:pilus assembly protein N-terminal domain-containing protein, partial [Bacillus cereus group sp. Bce019]|uniref:pilus assembly protein N-terminal domain-containing protein n=1 Tax=Bacillus cereus group sp. Bce019 TaxID=3445247 RepID=UPI003F1F55F3
MSSSTAYAAFSRLIFLLATLLAAWGVQADVTPPSDRIVGLVVGDQQRLHLPRAVARTAIGSGQIASAQLASDREL